VRPPIYQGLKRRWSGFFRALGNIFNGRGDGYPPPILRVWDHQIAMRTSILMLTTDIGSMHYRPRLMVGHDILACHGTSTDDNQYLVEEVSERRLVRAPSSVIQERLGDAHARVVLCGHSHKPHVIQLPTGP
jgi:hypothetical protein